MKIGRSILLLLLFGGAIIARGYWNATRDPIVRTATVHIADWPKDAPPIKALLLSDIHVSVPDMPPERLVRIVGQLNTLKPNIVLIAGDLVSEKRLATHLYSAAEVASPLRQFHAPLGVVVTLGNHDHWFDPVAMRTELARAGLTVLENQAIKRGPLVIGGVDDDFSHHANLAQTYAAMDALQGPRIILTHSPDIVPNLPSPVAAVLAGHMHCGQIRLPWSDAPLHHISKYGNRFVCGDITDHGQRVFVGAGLGTSLISLRYHAPPDVWLITLGP